MVFLLYGVSWFYNSLTGAYFIHSLQSQFIRHDTPHPRDLKARHPKITMHKIKDSGHLDGVVIKSRKSLTVCNFVAHKHCS